MAEIYVHAETGEEFEIPDGSLVVHNGDLIDTSIGPMRVHAEGVAEGEILYWHNPPETPAGELHPDVVVDYQPRFVRESGERRVLGSVSDEVDRSALGPRNTVSALTYFLARNPDTPHVNRPSITVLRQVQPNVMLDLPHDQTAEAQVEGYLAALIKAGLVEQRDDGSYAVTDAGRVELAN